MKTITTISLLNNRLSNTFLLTLNFVFGVNDLVSLFTIVFFFSNTNSVCKDLSTKIVVTKQI